MAAIAPQTSRLRRAYQWSGPRLPAPLVAGTGLALVVGVILYGALAHAPLRVLWIALALLGCAMQIAAPALDRPVAKPTQERAVAPRASGRSHFRR